MPNTLRNLLADPKQQSVRDVTLETDRLILREHTESDLESVMMYAADPEVACYTTTPPQSRDQVAANLARIADHRAATPVRLRYELAVVRRADLDLIGWIPLLLSEDPDRHEAEIGWTIARAHWRQGYGTEAAEAMLRFAFERLNLHRVWARCLGPNAASIKLMERLGMRREAQFRWCQIVAGEWIDILHYAILEDEWWEQKRTPLQVKLEQLSGNDC